MKLWMTLFLFSFSVFGSELNIYSSRHYPIDKLIFKEFEKKSGIKINLVHIKKAAQLIERLKVQGQKADADIIITVDAGNLWRAAEENLFQPLKMPEIEKVVPENLRDSKGLWTGISVRSRVIAVDKSKIDPSQIKTYQDLTKPFLKNKVLIRSSSNVYNQSLIASFVSHDGAKETQKWTNSLVGSLARKPQGGDRDQLRAMAKGQGAVAVVNSYYAGKMWASRKKADTEVMKNITLVFPNQEGRGTHINISGLGIGRYAPNLSNAKKFIDFMLSKDVQKKFAEANFEFPARKGVRIEGIMAKYQDAKFDSLPLSRIGENTPTALKIMDKAHWR